MANLSARPILVAPLVTAMALFCATAVEAKPRRIVHVDADTLIVHRARVVVVRDGDTIIRHAPAARAPIIRDRIIERPWHPRPTRAAMIACQMGPHFLGAAWRGKRYRPYTRTGRPRICVAAMQPARQFL